jgi:hypothetical protein
MNFGYFTTFQSLDKGLIERFGPTGFTVSTFSISSNFTGINSGILYQVAFLIITFVVLFLAFFTTHFSGLAPSFSFSFFFLIFSYTTFLLLETEY